VAFHVPASWIPLFPTPKHLRCIRAVERHAPTSSMMKRVHSRVAKAMSWVAMSMAASSLAKRWASTFFPGGFKTSGGFIEQKQPGRGHERPASATVAFDRARDDGRGLGQMADAE